MKHLYRITLILPALLLCCSLFGQLKLSSYPTAKATIYLDFDGENVNSYVWNGGTAFTCAPAALNNAQVTEIFNRVAEDYRPFNVNITTDINVFMAAPLNQRIRVIVTPTSAWFAGVGGVAYLGSFTWGDDTPCFVFSDRLNNSAKMVAECCSHESGHTLGLTHQSKYDNSCNLAATYNEGNGTGQAAWAPIMGNSYYRNMSGWNNGPTPYGCANVQDNLTILTTKNGFTYRADDYSDEFTTAAESDAANMYIEGVISTNADKDMFRFNLAEGSNIIIDASPFSVGANNEGADLDVKLSIYDANQQLIRVYSPDNSMSVYVDTILLQGTYYMAIEGTGNSFTSDYGSLGSYTIKGLAKILPIRSVTLTGILTGSRHTLSWNIVTEAAIQSIDVEDSKDGIHFSSLAVTPGGTTHYVAAAANTGTYYRIKATSVFGQVLHSNTVMLQPKGNAEKIFTVSTLVTRDNIIIRATDKYQYLLSDISGNILARGNGTAGMGNINVAGKPAGMYILYLISNGNRTAERIVKQ
jgi:hypothetical protein